MQRLFKIVDICQLLIALHFALSSYLGIQLEQKSHTDRVPVFVKPEHVEYHRLTEKALDNV